MARRPRIWEFSRLWPRERQPPRPATISIDCTRARSSASSTMATEFTLPIASTAVDDLVFQLSNGAAPIGLDLSGAKTLGDVVDKINSSQALRAKSPRRSLPMEIDWNSPI